MTVKADLVHLLEAEVEAMRAFAVGSLSAYRHAAEMADRLMQASNDSADPEWAMLTAQDGRAARAAAALLRANAETAEAMARTAAVALDLFRQQMTKLP